MARLIKYMIGVAVFVGMAVASLGIIYCECQRHAKWNDYVELRQAETQARIDAMKAHMQFLQDVLDRPIEPSVQKDKEC